MGLFNFGKKKEVKETIEKTIEEKKIPVDLTNDLTNGKRRLIVACGSGVATSQTIASKVKSMLENDGIHYPVEAVDYKSIKTELKDASIYLYIAKPDEEVLQLAKQLGVHVFAGVPFLTSMGIESIYEEIKLLTK